MSSSAVLYAPGERLKRLSDDKASLYRQKKHARGNSARKFQARVLPECNLTSEYHFKLRQCFCNGMAQTFFVSILVLAFFLCPLSQTQTNEGASLLHETNQTPTRITGKSESFPAGCRLYQNRKLLQCRNAGLEAIPELKEDWNVFSV